MTAGSRTNAPFNNVRSIEGSGATITCARGLGLPRE